MQTFRKIIAQLVVYKNRHIQTGAPCCRKFQNPKIHQAKESLSTLYLREHPCLSSHVC